MAIGPDGASGAKSEGLAENRWLANGRLDTWQPEIERWRASDP